MIDSGAVRAYIPSWQARTYAQPSRIDQQVLRPHAPIRGFRENGMDIYEAIEKRYSVREYQNRKYRDRQHAFRESVRTS